MNLIMYNSLLLVSVSVVDLINFNHCLFFFSFVSCLRHCS